MQGAPARPRATTACRTFHDATAPNRNARDMAKHMVDPPKRKRSNCIACDLRRIMVCADVSDAELADLHTWIDDLHIEPGATLFSADCPANGVYCIRAGMVKLVLIDTRSGSPIRRPRPPSRSLRGRG